MLNTCSSNVPLALSKFMSITVSKWFFFLCHQKLPLPGFILHSCLQLFTVTENVVMQGGVFVYILNNGGGQSFVKISRKTQPAAPRLGMLH